MKKIEAKTLEEAYALATEAYGRSLTELDCEIVQHPSSGFLGLFAKTAMIIVAPKQTKAEKKSPKKSPQQEPKGESKKEPKKELAKAKKPAGKKPEPAQKQKIPETSEAPQNDKNSQTQNSVLESFFDTEETTKEPEVVTPVNNIALQEEIETELKSLIVTSCFDIDVVEVDVLEDTAYVFIDGEDAALLIGKEGYRYNALSYLISNWLQNKHNLYIKLEIAQFLASQQEMIRSYMEPVIEHVEQEGWGRTRALDGILVQIALEQLREEFPNKYVAIKRTRNGDRYVLINEFNKR